MAGNIALATAAALNLWNKEKNASWTMGTNWDATQTGFETFLQKYLFPKINETNLSTEDLGNRYDFLAKEVDFIGQYSEDYVILDTVPVDLNLSKSAELMLKQNYPKIATKLFESGVVRKQKFTLNNNDSRLNFSTLGDATKYNLGVYKNKISMINIFEEKEIRAMMIDYATRVCGDKREVSSMDELITETFNAILNLQNNSDKYNETNLASGGSVGRYTTRTKLKDMCILTTDRVKTFILNTVVANTFQEAGLDITNHIISFDDLGGVYKITKDVEIKTKKTVDYFKSFGDYQVEIGDIVPKESVVTFDVSSLGDFTDSFEEIKPETEEFIYLFDIRKVKYRRYTKGMLKQPFFNPEFDEVTYWLHYYAFKAMSPFYNNVTIQVNKGV